MNLYIAEQGSYARVDLNQLVIEKNKEILKEIPIKTIESITVVGNVLLSTQVISYLVKLKIPISYISSKGYYKFSIRGNYNVNISRQELQFRAFQDENYCLKLSKKTILSKVKNQILVLKRYNRSVKSLEIDKNIKHIKSKLKLINKVKNKNELLGIEGIIAKYYFDSFKYLLPAEFSFLGRNSYPATDPFNALLSFGYTLLLNDIITCLENKKVNPYKGFMHANKIGHPALASDLMEEYRPIIIDSLALNLVRRSIIKISDFHKEEQGDGYYIEYSKISKIIEKYNEKMLQKKSYIKNYKTDTRTIIYMQIQSLINSFVDLKPELFLTVVYR